MGWRARRLSTSSQRTSNPASLTSTTPAICPRCRHGARLNVCRTVEGERIYYEFRLSRHALRRQRRHGPNRCLDSTGQTLHPDSSRFLLPLGTARWAGMCFCHIARPGRLVFDDSAVDTAADVSYEAPRGHIVVSIRPMTARTPEAFSLRPRDRKWR